MVLFAKYKSIIDNMKEGLLREEPVKKSEKEKLKSAFEKFDYLLINVFIAAFIFLIIAQIANLRFHAIEPDTGSSFYEGEPLMEEVYLYSPCKMELKLTNIESCSELKVLVNGDEYCRFDNKTVLLDLKDGDVVELDASEILVIAEVQISGVSENKKEHLGKNFIVSEGITLVAKM